MQIIAICTQKGGAGKTTSAAALAQAAAKKGKKTLLIDLDPQASATYIVGAKAGGEKHILNGAAASDLIQNTGSGVDVIPASWELQNEATSKGSARRLGRAIEPLQNYYDYIFIDTPAKAGELQYNALQAANRVIIPANVDILNLQALYQMAATLEPFTLSNKELAEIDLLFTQCGRETKLAAQMKKTLTDKGAALGMKVIGAIPEAVALQEAQAMKESLFDYAPKSKPAAAYLEAFEAIARKPRKKK